MDEDSDVLGNAIGKENRVAIGIAEEKTATI